MVTVSHLRKKYGSREAISDLSLTMETGHIYGLLGPNGAGKTTTMNMMTGFLAPTGGKVEIEGHDILKDPVKAKKEIGYLPEIPPLYPEMTVGEYLAFVSDLKRVGKKNRKKEVDRVEEAGDLKSVKDRLIRNLSKGYKQRVGFAQALLGDPIFIILDEPTVGMDPRQLAHFKEELLALKKDHIILLSSHILSEVQEICDEIFILSKGKLILSGEAGELSDKLHEEKRLNIRGIGDPESARMSLIDLSGVKEVKILPIDSDNGEFSLLVSLTGSKDIRALVSQRLFERQFSILEMTEAEDSLEKVFLEVTAPPLEEPGPGKKKGSKKDKDKKKGEKK